VNIRVATIVIGLLDAAGCAAVAVGTFNSGSDPATIGFDYAAGVNFGRAAADDPPEHIGAAARRKRHDHGQRPRRPVLRGGRAQSATKGEQACDGNGKHASRNHCFPRKVQLRILI
jgi:hypothetical protein